jgi:hypothetical protein
MVVVNGTIGVAIMSVIFICFNSWTSQLMNTPLYVAQVGLLNLYIYFLTYLYSPTETIIIQVGANQKHTEIAKVISPFEIECL